MKFLFDLFPVILFFAAFKFAGIYVATGVAIAATFCQIAWVWFKHRKVDNMLWVSLVIITVFGGSPWAGCAPCRTPWPGARPWSPTTRPSCCGPKTPKPPPGPTCAVHWRWCARPKAAHPTRAEPPGLQRRATSPCNGSLIPADDAAVCANASDHRTIAGLRCTALATPTQPAPLKQALVCSQSGHGYCQLPD